MAGAIEPFEHESGRIHRFYDIICLLHSLSIVRGSRIKRKFSVEQDGCNIAKFRRDFADALAYICAYDKNAKCVTAIALGRRDEKIIVWIAANEKVKQKVRSFLNQVLKMLDEIANETVSWAPGHYPITQSHQKPKPCNLLNVILEFNKERNHKYYTAFVSCWTKICKSGAATGEAPKLQYLSICVTDCS